MKLYSLLAVFCLAVQRVTGEADVRLAVGSNDTGIVEVYNNETSTWEIVCGWRFTDVEAAVVCKELGFLRGNMLPFAAFGQYGGQHTYPLRSCTGQELSIRDCEYDLNTSPRTCAQSQVYYAAITCYNQVPVSDSKVRLGTNDSPTPNAGKVSIFRNSVWGRVCPSFWDDKDANVICRQFGYLGGVATRYADEPGEPYVESEVNCHGNETSLEECEMLLQICYDTHSAGAICYSQKEPSVRIVGEDSSGRVELEYDGSTGTICAQDWSNDDADVVCRQAGYAAGVVQSVESGVGDVFLTNVSCEGAEDSIFGCVTPGWQNVTDVSCLNHTEDAGVFCYKSVRLIYEDSSDTIAMGLLQVYKGSSWNYMCSEQFTQNNADVVCRQLGYANAKILAPRSFVEVRAWSFVHHFDCEGTEQDLLECPVQWGTCISRDDVGLLCLQDGVDESHHVFIQNGFWGTVLVTKFGVNGTVCRENFDDTDARVLCREFGYQTGVVYGTQEFYTRYQPIWMGSVDCVGTEASFYDCPHSEDVTKACSDDKVFAGVLCYNYTGVKVRIAGGSFHYTGRIEMAYDGVWGSICNKNWGYFDSKAACKQAGYPDGRVSSSPLPPGSGPVYMDDLKCKDSEKSLLTCANRGWLAASSDCLNHTRDAAVACTPWVKLYAGYYQGAVEFYNETTHSYGLVCADGFDRNAADVVCRRELQFNFGWPICCSAFGPTDRAIVVKANCTGTELSFKNCNLDFNSCPSGKYASVMCYNYNLPESIGSTTLSRSAYGAVSVTYHGRQGFICSDEFDDMDANVICRQLGYASGFATKVSITENSFHTNLRWISNPGCTGTESRLSVCPGVQWGQLDLCSLNSVAGVYCQTVPGEVGVEIRLTDTAKGRLEMKVSGQWGTVCGVELTNTEAGVICRQLGYRDGVAMEAGYYGGGAGTVWVTAVNCTGEETNVMQCVMTDFGGSSSSDCRTHKVDAAVKCFSEVRLTGSNFPNYGRVEIYRGTQWEAICSDQGFDDNEAKVLCRQMGFIDGRAQCCSPLGPLPEGASIMVTGMRCTGFETSISQCQYDTHNSCTSGQYAAVFCSDLAIGTQEVEIRLPENSFYGPLSVSHFGFWGYICGSGGWTDKEAKVACHELRYADGFAVITRKLENDVITLASVRCSGLESRLGECIYESLIQQSSCYGQDTIAGVLCSNDTDGVKLQLGDSLGYLRKVEIYVNSQTLTVYDDHEEFVNTDANVFCRSLGYAGGTESMNGRNRGASSISGVKCTGSESSFLQCPAYWDPRKILNRNRLDAGVECFKSVRLLAGDGQRHGALEIYEDGAWGTVCPENFDEIDAGVACRNLGFEMGLALCCSPYGYVGRAKPPRATHMQCQGTEEHFTDCIYEALADGATCSVPGTYAAVACYDQGASTDFTVSLASESYTGEVIVTYFGIPGRICNDGWDDEDAVVVCKELGLDRGMAYTHHRDFYSIPDSGTPYWITNVQCNGHEAALHQCQLNSGRSVGAITNCQSGNHAGVICFSNTGMFYRLTGGASDRYGRVEVSINGDWSAMCNTYWDQREAHILCRQRGFTTGDPYYVKYLTSVIGPVWDSQFKCVGNEARLNDCPHTGWHISAGRDCILHRRDAGVFCYQSVKLSTGIGPDIKEGGVLLYKDSTWYAVCETNFDNASAKVVCQELGFVDGYAVCCSGYGFVGHGILQTHTLKCTGQESSVMECLVNEYCLSQNYASVVCLLPPTTTAPTTVTTTTTTIITPPTSVVVPSTKHTTVPSSVPSPVTTQPVTTQAPVTTHAPVTTQAPATTAPQTPTTVSETSTKSEVLPFTDPTGTIIGVIAAVLFIIVMVLIFIVVFKYRQRKKKRPILHERFHDDIIEEHPDGSVGMHNQVLDLQLQSQENVVVASDGSVRYTTLPVPSAPLPAYSNPGYESLNLKPAEGAKPSDIDDVPLGASNGPTYDNAKSGANTQTGFRYVVAVGKMDEPPAEYDNSVNKRSVNVLEGEEFDNYPIKELPEYSELPSPTQTTWKPEWPLGADR